jgi:hypothetical protein
MATLTAGTQLDDILGMLKTVTNAPIALKNLIESLRPEMEIPATTGFRGGGGATGETRTFDKKPVQNAWKTGATGAGRFSSMYSDKSRPEEAPWHSHRALQPVAQTKPPGRYQSRFTSGAGTNLDGKILTSIIGNKLNAFTELTYNDTRDFIYQIMDSGETEFIKDFVEKVFSKATLEELYCGLFAKLIAEIAKKYTGMYNEMNQYHSKFLEIFDDVEDHADADYSTQVKKKQYRMGYGHFLSELAGQNALEKSQLLGMIAKIMKSIWDLNTQDGKVKTVEEYIDCVVRLITSLKSKSKVFFESVKLDISTCMLEQVTALIDKKSGISRPSLSVKARFGLMDLKDLLANK